MSIAVWPDLEPHAQTSTLTFCFLGDLAILVVALQVLHVNCAPKTVPAVILTCKDPVCRILRQVLRPVPQLPTGHGHVCGHRVSERQQTNGFNAEGLSQQQPISVMKA